MDQARKLCKEKLDFAIKYGEGERRSAKALQDVFKKGLQGGGRREARKRIE
jgi:hypothetical protein